MRHILIILIVSLLSIIQFACKDNKKELYKFRKDSQISDLSGLPINKSVYYFPLEIFIDSIVWENGASVKIDTFKVEWFSRELHKFDEPVLYNYFLGKKIYRFTWLRSFHPAIVIKLEYSGDSILLVEKKLTEYQRMVNVKDNHYRTVTDSVKLEIYKSKFTDKLSNKFDSLIIQNKYFSMPTTIRWQWGTDGARWILESHSNSGYHVVDRWCGGNKEYLEICEFLLDNSRFINEERY